MNSLRARMAVGFTLSFALFAALVCVAFSVWAGRSAHRDASERVVSAADHLRLEWNGRSPREAFEEVHEDARLDEVAMLLVDREGRVLGQDGHPALSWPLPNHGWIVRLAQGPNGVAVAGIQWAPIGTRLRSETTILALFSLLATIGVGVAAWLLVGRTLRPIGLLAEGADEASADPLHARLSAPSEDAEITHLVATLNGFLGRLAEGARNRKEFYASAAHELRTPLAVLSAEVEMALARPRSAEEHQEMLTDLWAQIRRLTSLVEALLTLNRIENDRSEEMESSDPADLADSALAGLASQIQAKRLSVRTDLDSITAVSAPASHLSVVVRNLVENAVRHSPEGGSISIVSDGAFRVGNDLGPYRGLDLERMFEPFVQGDRARSSEGNGLGLAICRRIAQVNGWRLTLREVDGKVEAELEFHELSQP